MKESKLIEMQNKIEVLGSALKNALIKLNALQDFAQGTLTSLQVHVGKDGWEKIVEQLKQMEQKEEKEEELPPSQRK